MFKILISDDEHYIREGLMNAIDWKKYDFNEVLVAANGLEAKEKIDQFQPQVIITDIKMPGMDGLQLTKYAMSRNQPTKVILLSGYNEFEYAQKAISYGAFEFILKPSNYDELNRVLHSAVDQLKKEEEQEKEFARLKSEFQERIADFRQNFLKSLILFPPIGDHAEQSRLHESLNLYDLPRQGDFALILAKLDDFHTFVQNTSVEERQLNLLKLESKFLSFLSDLREKYELEFFYIPLKEDIYAIFVAASLIEQEKIVEVCEEFQCHVEDVPFTISFGIGNTKQSYFDMNRAYIEASNSLDYIFYYGKEAIIHYSDLPTISGEKTEDSYLSYLDEIKPLIKAIKIGDQQTCMDQLHYLFQLFEYNKESSKKVKSICVEIISQMKNLFTKQPLFPSIPKELYVDILAIETNEGCFNMLKETIAPMLQKIQDETKMNHKKVVQTILDIIEQSYQEEITLTAVAAQVYLNSSYVSRLLKRECGKSFTELLTECRMEKAKELLKDPTNKINEVAENVGMPDAQYFSSKFKKYTGLTPSEYRDHFEDIF